MRSVILALAVGFVLVAGSGAAAPEEPKVLVEKGIKALGGAEALAKVKGMRVKAKGTVEVMGMSLEFTSEAVIDLNGRARNEVSFEIMGQKATFVQVFDGKKGWNSILGTTMEVEGDALKELKEECHFRRVALLAPILKDNATLATIGETKVNGKPANGVKVSAKGFNDVELYFDPTTGLVVKSIRQAYDTNGNKDVSQEVVNSEFKEANGIKYAAKSVMQRDGKKFLDIEVTEYKPLETIDDSAFAKP